ncbi:MAG: hypothetical protein CMJ18_05965 [Phycisphaeraceae bacterium]|nr:hypothetical protein [Phycisphaeraceae bacterium]
MSGETRVAISLMLLALTAAPGCRGTERAAPAKDQTSDAPPADFALVLYIEGHDRPWDPARFRSQYVLEPDRGLRVALGPGAEPGYYPALTRRLTPAEQGDVYRWIRSHELDRFPAGMITSADDVRYVVQITSHEQTSRYATNSAASPATRRLVEMLVACRRTVLPVPPDPDQADR